MTPNAEFLQALYSGAPIAADKMRERKWLVNLNHRYNCRYCHKPVMKDEAAVVGTYWWPHKCLVHLGCKAEGYQQEAIDCQCLDGNCNDCFYFRRTKGNNGTCADDRRDGEFSVSPGNWQGMPCFKHRLQNKEP